MAESGDNEKFKELMNDPELTEEKLTDQLNAYHAAFQQEFEEKSKKAPEDVEEYTTDFFKKNVPMAAAQIVYLAANAESETVRSNNSKYIIERAFADGREDGDPMQAILDKLTAKEPVEK